ncbi:MAG TPA: PQQ-dependent sugar dehydrogenase [Thermoanaerobaculia bacterium]|nr:PQQ-dependent sugar dehydrogenase [Thermoanaerobaculia bacterium]
MSVPTRIWIALAILVTLSCAPHNGGAAEAQRQGASRLPVHEIKLPPGFKIDVYAEDVPNARQMALSPKGILYVGSRSEGKVHAVVDENRDGRADKVHLIARGLNMPSGVAFRDGALYVAEVSRVLRWEAIDGKLDDPPKPTVVSDAFPRDRHHGWKFIAFGPDGQLYVPVGAPCNVCKSEKPIYASITRMRVGPDGKGSQPEVFASGIRNTVGFDWHPQSKELWMAENGRDNLGNDIPADELLRAPKAGLHFGFPYCHAGDIADPEFGKQRPCADFTPPAIKLGPHVAAIGMRFYTGGMFPAAYRNQAFIAEHGSWNRDQPLGYRVTLVKIQDGRALSYETFAEGWLRPSGRAWGRPADVLVMPDGALLVSDDEAGAIYRISYAGERKAG